MTSRWFVFLIVCYLAVVMTACAKAPQAGPAGARGAQGDTGAGADSVTAVQLCGGTTHYPDTFCEVAFCIGGELFATYSANGGFSTLIPSGAYASNGINCSCTVTVYAGCVLSL